MKLTDDLLAELAAEAEAVGLLRLGVVDLDDPGFEPARAALDRYLDEGRHGEMDFMARTREVRKRPEHMLPGARSLLVALVPYRGDAGPIARYARTADYHTVMHRRLDVVADALRARLPGVETLVCVDTKPVLERAAAVLGGLGFIGKNGCVIAPGLGSYVLLGEIITTAAWSGRAEIDGVIADACGSCRRCLDACPTNAFTEPGRLDPRRCISYLTIEHRGPIDDALADAFDDRLAGCDVCQEVCPYNASAVRDARVPGIAWIEPAAGGLRDVADPIALAGIGSARYRAFVRDTALRRIPRRSMRRNALLVLGNRPGPLDADEREAVEAAAGDDDPQIRAAAARAARRG